MAILYVDLTAGTDVVAATISGASKANPCVITATSHGFSNGEFVYIYGVAGMIQLNNGVFIEIANVTEHTFELVGVNSTSYSNYTSGGKATTSGQTTNPFLTVNAAVALTTPEPHDIRVAKTAAHTVITDDVTWTENSKTVTTTADLTGSIIAGDHIGKPTAAGNGSEETFYRVNSITASTITLDCKYGGTTGTTTTILKVTYVTTGVAGTTAITIASYTCLSGGWNLSGTPIQDGETWFTPNGNRTTSTARGIAGGNSGIINKINILECYYGIDSGTARNITRCTISSYSIGIYSGSGSTLEYCCMIKSNGPNSGYYSSTGGIITNCYGVGLVSVFSSGIFNNCKCMSNDAAGFAGQNYGFYNNCTATNCVYGFNVSMSSFYNNCTATNCVYGFYFNTTSPGALLKGCTATSCTYGAYLTQYRGAVFETCFFNNCSYGIFMDTHCGAITIINSSFLNPTNYAIYRQTLNVGTVTCKSCTIDEASLIAGKAYNISLNGGYMLQQYALQNSFGGQTGSIYTQSSVMKDSTVFRTSAPSVAINWISTTTVSYLDIKIVSAYVAASLTKTYSVWIKTNSALWAGTIIPKWKLDGVTIKTESTISSLTTDWVQYSWTCDSSLITSDGELSMEFNPNCNTYGIYIDDFTIS